ASGDPSLLPCTVMNTCVALAAAWHTTPRPSTASDGVSATNTVAANTRRTLTIGYTIATARAVDVRDPCSTYGWKMATHASRSSAPLPRTAAYSDARYRLRPR